MRNSSSNLIMFLDIIRANIQLENLINSHGSLGNFG